MVFKDMQTSIIYRGNDMLGHVYVYFKKEKRLSFLSIMSFHNFFVVIFF